MTGSFHSHGRVRARLAVIYFPAKNGLYLIFHYNDAAGSLDIHEGSGPFAAIIRGVRTGNILVGIIIKTIKKKDQ